MHRGKKIILLAHCILNVNSKVIGLAHSTSGLNQFVFKLMENDFGIVQLPCVEQDMCGLRRWGQVQEQLDHPRYIERCRELLHPIVLQIMDFINNNYQVSAVIGLDGSPSCGVNMTCSSEEWQGEMEDTSTLEKKICSIKQKSEPGVMMRVLRDMLLGEGIDIPFYALREENPTEDINTIFLKITENTEDVK